MTTSAQTQPLHVVIMAAGQGTRMQSAFPKVLHPLAGKPLLGHVLDLASGLKPEKIHVIIGHEGDKVREHFSERDINWVEQKERLGTGHAVMQALPAISDNANVVILSGDVPLTSSDTLKKLTDQVTEKSLSLVVANVRDPFGLGRVVRDSSDNIHEIVEERDASPDVRALNEIYSGIMCAPAAFLKQALPELKNDNAQGEYYLTAVIGKAVTQGYSVLGVSVQEEEEVFGINSRTQLIVLERYFQHKQAQELLQVGVSICDPTRFDLRGSLQTGKDVFIDINVIFEGKVEIGSHVKIGSNTVIRNSRIGDNVAIKENCVIEDAIIEADCIVGPFARLRPGTFLNQSVHVGNFVEIKKSSIDTGSKVNHLSYIGDATIGKNVNVGAGTITCNYDGINKHQTIIEDGAFIGSDTQLVAPVTIGKDATIGAGTTITKDAPANQLTLTRKEQRTVERWQRPKSDEK